MQLDLEEAVSPSDTFPCQATLQKESSMSDALIVLHTAIAIIAIVLLIVVAKVDPLISLVIGTLYLGVAAGLGFGGTIGSLTRALAT